MHIIFGDALLAAILHAGQLTLIQAAPHVCHSDPCDTKMSVCCPHLTSRVRKMEKNHKLGNDFQMRNNYTGMVLSGEAVTNIVDNPNLFKELLLFSTQEIGAPTRTRKWLVENSKKKCFLRKCCNLDLLK